MPKARMQACGGLMTATAWVMPYMPRFETVQVGGHGNREIYGAVLLDSNIRPRGVGLRNLAQGDGHRLEDQVIDGKPETPLRVPPKVFPESKQLIHLAVGREVKVRDRLLGLGESAGGDAVHVVERMQLKLRLLRMGWGFQHDQRWNGRLGSRNVHLW